MTNFSFSWQNCEFFWSQQCCTHFLTQNEELSKKIGREEAIVVVTEACRKASEQECALSDVLKADDRITKEFTNNEIDEFMLPTGYLGNSTSSK